MVKINWTQQAKNDIIAIGEFIGQNSKKYARIQVQVFAKELSNSGNIPILGGKYLNSITQE